jgi:excisionase family DNA binding protein
VKSQKRAATAEPSDLCVHGLLRPSAAAKFLGVSRSTLYGLMRSGQLPHCELSVNGDGNGDRRIPRQALVLFASSRLRVGTTEAA